jgi:hypothetical protein
MEAYVSPKLGNKIIILHRVVTQKVIIEESLYYRFRLLLNISITVIFR